MALGNAPRAYRLSVRTSEGGAKLTIYPRCTKCSKGMLWDGYVCASCAIEVAERKGMKPKSETDGYRRMLYRVAGVEGRGKK